MNTSSRVFYSKPEIIPGVPPVVEIIDELMGGGQEDIVGEFEEAIKDIVEGEQEPPAEENKSESFLSKIKKLIRL